MTLKIIKWPNPGLEFPCGPVEEFNESLKTLVEEMNHIMFSNMGAGLAAPQVGIPARVFIMSTSVYTRDYQVFVNPVIESVSHNMVLMREGCLSMPGVAVSLARPQTVQGHAFRVDGTRFDFDYVGALARCVLHEMDHLDGILMFKHMNRQQRRATEKKLRSKG